MWRNYELVQILCDCCGAKRIEASGGGQRQMDSESDSVCEPLHWDTFPSKHT